MTDGYAAPVVADQEIRSDRILEIDIHQPKKQRLRRRGIATNTTVQNIG
ncbi:MAG TPA: hypothetical protein PL193_11220 [Xanthobacteraceae bacterium]|nr:hypothetical protein [Xanthobacteraceae bacterium]